MTQSLSHFWEKTPNTLHLKEARFILAHSLSKFQLIASWKTCQKRLVRELLKSGIQGAKRQTEAEERDLPLVHAPVTMSFQKAPLLTTSQL